MFFACLLIFILSLLFLFFLWLRKKNMARPNKATRQTGKTSFPAPLYSNNRHEFDNSQLLQTYFRGLSYVLANETDKAVAEFIKVARVNTTTAEIYLALGQLFRNSGEMERAIRVHRDILLRQNLPENIRQRTFFEIGLDYAKAGLFDRACRTFEEILSHDSKNHAARLELVSLYEKTREWEKALQLFDNVPPADKHNNIIAHLHTEVAKTAILNGNREKAMTFFHQALQLDENCIDAWLHYGDLLLSDGLFEEALEKWNKAFVLNPDLVSLLINRFTKLEPEKQALAENDFFIRHAQCYSNNNHFKMAYIGWLINSGNLEQAGGSLQELMRKKTGDREIFSLMQKLLTALNQKDQGEEQLYKELILNFFSTQLRFEKNYRCRKCGYRLEIMLWKCPRCSTWDSITVI